MYNERQGVLRCFSTCTRGARARGPAALSRLTSTARERTPLPAPRPEPRCPSSANTRQQDVKNSLKDSDKCRAMRTTGLSTSFKV